MTTLTAEHPCPFCMCGRRAPVQASDFDRARQKYPDDPRYPQRAGDPGSVPGSISWVEHEEAWMGYAARYPGQSAQRMAERGGFSWWELCEFLGHAPTTWRPHGNSEAREQANALASAQKKAGTYRER